MIKRKYLYYNIDHISITMASIFCDYNFAMWTVEILLFENNVVSQCLTLLGPSKIAVNISICCNVAIFASDVFSPITSGISLMKVRLVSLLHKQI